MLVRSSTPLNALADAVLARLREISSSKNAAYITAPKSVERLMVMGDFAGKQKPLLRLSVISWEVEPQAAQRFHGTMTFGVHCMTESVEAAEQVLLDLVSDVIYALARDVQVDGQAIYLFPVAFEPNVDLSARTGLAVTTVRFECLYKFDAVAP